MICIVCKRPLTNLLSIDLRMGPTCAAKRGVVYPSAKKEKDQMDFEEMNRPFPKMQNRRMAEKLSDGRAIDLSKCERTPEGDYIVKHFDEDGDFDYCDAETESWIWSIGKFPDGSVIASTSGKFYQNESCRCVWLR